LSPTFDDGLFGLLLALPPRDSEADDGLILAIFGFSLISRCTHRAHAASQLIEKPKLSIQSIIGAVENFQSKAFISFVFLSPIDLIRDWIDWQIRRKRASLDWLFQDHIRSDQ
jgi:hypothetical protein